MDVVRAIENVGSKSGATRRPVVVAACGEEDPELIAAGIGGAKRSAAAKALLEKRSAEETKAALENRLVGAEDPDVASARRLAENAEVTTAGPSPARVVGLASLADSLFESDASGSRRRQTNAASTTAAATAKSDEGSGGDGTHRTDPPPFLHDGSSARVESVRGDPDVATHLSARERRLFELRLKLNESRKANRDAVVEEKKKNEAPEAFERARRARKERLVENRRDELLERRGVDKTKKHLLETAEAAAELYAKRDKKRRANVSGGEVFSSRNLFAAYEKRMKNVPPAASVSLAEKPPSATSGDWDARASRYGSQGASVPEENIDVMVAELEAQKKKRADFSRRRVYREARDVTHINDRNEHFNKKLHRAYGEHTAEIKANLERGTALPEN
jgi:hypothetical protein